MLERFRIQHVVPPRGLDSDGQGYGTRAAARAGNYAARDRGRDRSRAVAIAASAAPIADRGAVDDPVRVAFPAALIGGENSRFLLQAYRRAVCPQFAFPNRTLGNAFSLACA